MQYTLIFPSKLKIKKIKKWWSEDVTQSNIINTINIIVELIYKGFTIYSDHIIDDNVG